MGSLVDTIWGGVERRALCAVGSMRVEDWRGYGWLLLTVEIKNED